DPLGIRVLDEPVAGGRGGERLPGPVPLENTIRFSDLRDVDGSGGVRVLVDQAAHDASSVDPSGVEVGQGGAERVAIAVRDVLSDALVRPGGVVMRLLLGEYGAQVR